MPLVMLREAIVAAWEALTPPSEVAQRYRYVEKFDLSGVSAHRTFFFSRLRGGGITEQGLARHMIRHEFDAVLCMYLPERASDRFDRPYREFQTLAIEVSKLSVSGVIAPRVTDYRVEEFVTERGGDLDLIMTIVADVKESSNP